MKITLKSRAERVAVFAVLAALSFGLGWLDLLIPLDAVGIPGIKLGLANLALLAALYLFDWRYAALVSALRLLLSFLIFGNVTALLYSLCGGAFALLGMTLVKKTKLFDPVGVSVSGAVLHNAGQVLAASLLMETRAIWGYFPVLILTGTASGLLIGAAFTLLSGRLFDLHQ